MGKYYNRMKTQSGNNIHALKNVPILKKKVFSKKLNLKSLRKFSPSYNKLQLLKKSKTPSIRSLFNISEQLVKTECGRQNKGSESRGFTVLDRNSLKISTKKDGLIRSNKKKKAERDKRLKNGDDSFESLQTTFSSMDMTIEEDSYENHLWSESRSLEDRIRAKKNEKRLLKNEKRKNDRSTVENKFLKLGVVSLNSEIDFCVINRSRVLLIMCHPCSLYFFGVLNMKVVHGRFEVHGYPLDSQTESLPIYSPVGTSRMRISTVENGKPGKLTREKLLELGVSLENINEILAKQRKSNFAAAILETNSSDLCSSVWPEFVEKYSGQTFLPLIQNSKLSRVENVLQCKFQSDVDAKDRNFFIEPPEWNKVLQYIFKGYKRVAICGGKDVGKSTLLRYLVNRTLPEFGAVLVIDCDPGQSEFVPPGCVSAVLVESPLLGPHFTHLLQPQRSVFIGEVDMNRNPSFYIDGVDNITTYCQEEEKYQNIPWIINTMGYAKGFGVVLNSTVLKKVSPSLVVQIKCADHSRNYSTRLTPQYIEKNLLRNVDYTNNHEICNYKLVEIGSAADSKSKDETNKSTKIRNYSAPVLRQIMLLSYFGKLINKNVKTIFEVVPYMIDYTKIHLKILNDDSQLNEESILDVINGSLVALCRKDREGEELSNYECYGYGIVRAIDRVAKRLFVTTPVGKNIAQVDTLLKGAICLPDTLYTQPPSTVVGHIPFISCNVSNELQQRVHRQFRPK